jgi:putative phosphoribosyl transferase
VRHKPLFRDRDESGRLLAERLSPYAGRDDVVVLGLPRGGVPVAAAVARELRALLDVLVVAKLGVPGQRELAMGALGSGGSSVLNRDVIAAAFVSDRGLADAVANGIAELERREREYRGDRPSPPLGGRTAILVDDGLATGATMRAAARSVRMQSPGRIIVAVPVAPRSTVSELQAEVDEVVCVATPEPFISVGYWYDDFDQVDDDTVRALLGPSPALE